MDLNKIYQGDCLELSKNLTPDSLDLVFFSPPYWDVHKYSTESKEIGFGQSYEAYLNALFILVEKCKKALKPTGNLVINVMDLVRQNRPIMVSNDLINKIQLNFIERIVWHIPNKCPVASNVRFSNKFEWILHWSKEDKYFFDKDSVREPHSHYAEKDKRKWKWNAKGKCPGNAISIKYEDEDYWSIPAYKVSGVNKLHIAGFPIALVERVIKSWCPEGGAVLDPFMGSGQTGFVASRLNRNFIGFELSPDYAETSSLRLGCDLVK